MRKNFRSVSKLEDCKILLASTSFPYLVASNMSNRSA